MEKGTIEGIGSLHGGEYDSIRVEGMGKLKNNASAPEVDIEGTFKVKGKLTAGRISTEGVVRAFRDIRADEVSIEGIMKLRRAGLQARRLSCEGILVCTGEVSADDVQIDGLCSLHRLYGDTVRIRKDTAVKVKFQKQFPKALLTTFSGLYFGRQLPLDGSSAVDILECTTLEAEGLRADVIRANQATLTKGCRVGKLYCDGEIQISPDCVVNEIYQNGVRTVAGSKEETKMANANFVRILEAYKAGKISADEAETMAASLGLGAGVKGAGPAGERAEGLPWEEDGVLRIVAFIGRKLLKKGDPAAKNLSVSYEGEALNVDCAFDLTCGEVRGSASAGGDMNCRDVGKNASAQGDLTCGAVGAAASAGGDLHCGPVGGNASAGGDLTCGAIGGSASAGGDMTCKGDINGFVSAGGSVRQ